MPVYEALASEACPPEPPRAEWERTGTAWADDELLELLILLLELHGVEEFVRILRRVRMAVYDPLAIEDPERADDDEAASPEADPEAPGAESDAEEGGETDPAGKPTATEEERT
jgi:hypothetical protein